METAELWFGDHVGHEAKNVRPGKADKITRSSLCSGFDRGVLTKNYRARSNCEETTRAERERRKRADAFWIQTKQPSMAEIG
jgi:hypothetical protein